MTKPVTRCMVVRAADSPFALLRLHQAIQLNLKSGSLLILPCSCNPKCRELTELETDAIITKLERWESLDKEDT